jgi:hypothetical protein
VSSFVHTNSILSETELNKAMLFTITTKNKAFSDIFNKEWERSLHCKLHYISVKNFRRQK